MSSDTRVLRARRVQRLTGWGFARALALVRVRTVEQVDRAVARELCDQYRFQKVR